MKKNKIVAFILAMLMLVSCIPFTVSADANDNGTGFADGTTLVTMDTMLKYDLSATATGTTVADGVEFTNVKALAADCNYVVNNTDPSTYSTATINTANGYMCIGTEGGKSYQVTAGGSSTKKIGTNTNLPLNESTKYTISYEIKISEYCLTQTNAQWVGFEFTAIPEANSKAGYGIMMHLNSSNVQTSISGSQNSTNTSAVFTQQSSAIIDNVWDSEEFTRIDMEIDGKDVRVYVDGIKYLERTMNIDYTDTLGLFLVHRTASYRKTPAYDFFTMRNLVVKAGNVAGGNVDLIRDNYEKKIADLLDCAKTATAGSRYTQQAIDGMKARLQTALNELEDLTSIEDIEECYERCEADYITFLGGSKPLASFHLISDVHVDSDGGKYAEALKGMAKINADTNIGLVIAGDNTNSASASQYKQFYDTTANYSPVSAENTAIVMGNHDVRGSSNRYNDPSKYNPSTSYWATSKGLYLQYNAKYMPNTDTLYHTKTLGGYTFIMLNTELDLSDYMYMTSAQLEWLDQTLAAAYADNPGRPIFIVSHQPLYETHTTSNRQKTVLVDNLTEEESNARIKAVLQKYPTSIFLSGHLHNNFGNTVGVVRPFGAAVDIPSLGKGTVKGGGYEVQIYSDQVVFRAINYATGEYLPEYDVVISIGANNVSAIYKEAQNVLADTGKYSAAEIANIQTLSNSLGKLINVKYSEVSAVNFYTSAQHADINEAASALKTALTALIGDVFTDWNDHGSSTQSGDSTDSGDDSTDADADSGDDAQLPDASAPAEDTAESDAAQDEKDGCGSCVTLGGVALGVAACCTTVLVTKKKKDD